MIINRYIVAGAIALLFGFMGVIILAPTSIPLSPLGNLAPTNTTSSSSSSYVILGFAPYWNLKKITPQALASSTHIAYFNLLLNGDGTLYTKVNRREEYPGFTNYKRIMSGTMSLGKKPFILTFMPESQAALADSITSPASRQKTIGTILTTLKESGATGVNIDYEPLGDTDPVVRDNFTLFIQELHAQLQSTTHNLPAGKAGLLSISIYASAANRPRIWDLAALASNTDYFVVMTYDYTMPVTDNVGPNAPLRGAGQLFDNDIVKNIAEISRLIPTEKILLGIPFYGYEWQTEDSTKYTTTTERGSMASLERIQKMIDDKTLELLWDRNTLTPYGIASSSGQTSQIYFENITSITLKLEFVKSAHLGGIAIWALGYEGDNEPLWRAITDSLSSRPDTP